MNYHYESAKQGLAREDRGRVRFEVSFKTGNQTTLSPYLWTIDLYRKTKPLQTEKLVAPEVRRRNSEIHLRVAKFCQNLDVGNVMVEAEKKSLKARAKHARFLPFRRPTGKAIYVVRRPFILQYYIHKSFRCG